MIIAKAFYEGRAGPMPPSKAYYLSQYQRYLWRSVSHITPVCGSHTVLDNLTKRMLFICRCLHGQYWHLGLSMVISISWPPLAASQEVTDMADTPLLGLTLCWCCARKHWGLASESLLTCPLLWELLSATSIELTQVLWLVFHNS